MDFKERFLVEHAAIATSHSSHSLFDHLTGTRALLVEWGVTTDVSDAGLFHAVYGTESFNKAILPTDLRDSVRHVIGVEAEFIAHAFGAMTKDSFYANLDRAPPYFVTSRVDGGRIDLGGERFAALCHVFVANWLEQRGRAAPERRNIRAAEFRKMLAHLNPWAGAALVGAYGFAA